MSLLTNWGYTLTTADMMPNLLSQSEYDKYTGGRYTGDERIESNLSAVSVAIRNYCGWHLFPSQECQLKTTFADKRVTVVGNGLMIQLPATYVSAVSSVTIGGTEVEHFALETNGILRVYDYLYCIMPYTEIIVTYTAGLPVGMMSAIRELAAHRITHALAASYGITSESSGGVSVTYNANWVNSARSTALPDDNKEVLSPYKVRGCF